MFLGPFFQVWMPNRWISRATANEDTVHSTVAIRVLLFFGSSFQGPQGAGCWGRSWQTVSAMLGLDFPATTPFFLAQKLWQFGQLQGFDMFRWVSETKTSCGKPGKHSLWSAFQSPSVVSCRGTMAETAEAWGGCPSEGFLWIPSSLEELFRQNWNGNMSSTI